MGPSSISVLIFFSKFELNEIIYFGEREKAEYFRAEKVVNKLNSEMTLNPESNLGHMVSKCPHHRASPAQVHPILVMKF